MEELNMVNIAHEVGLDAVIDLVTYFSEMLSLSMSIIAENTDHDIEEIKDMLEQELGISGSYEGSIDTLRAAGEINQSFLFKEE
jgi:hypothetical protein